MGITIEQIIITFTIPIMCGLVSLNAIRRFMNGKIKQSSIEYQLCGYVFMNIFVFGLLFAFGRLSLFLTQ